jgi:hypothetical protein
LPSISPMIRIQSKQPRAKSPLFVLAALSLLVFCFLMAGFPGSSRAQAGSSDSLLQRTILLPQVEAHLASDGTLQIFHSEAEEALLEVRLDGLPVGPRGRWRGQRLETLTTLIQEGSPGGARGFSADADDDGDGRIDEDRRDGKDNDGDGKVDEDFAAVSDHMAVVHRTLGQRFTHLESYHWPLPGLRSTLFLELDTDQSEGATLSFQGGGDQWQEAQITSLLHRATGKVENRHLQPFVMRTRLARTDEDAEPGVDSWLWVGVQILDGPAGLSARQDRSEGVLRFPVSARPLRLALVLAPTWPRLSQQLGLARQVHEGLADPVTGRRAPWIVPASCSLYRAGSSPSVKLVEGSEGELVVRFQVEENTSPLLDFDSLSLAGNPLGPPSRLVWMSDEGLKQARNWQEVTPRTLRRLGGYDGHPFVTLTDAARPDSRGVLELHYSGTTFSEKSQARQLSGFRLDGRPFSAAVQAPGKPTLEPLAPTASGSFELVAADTVEPTDVDRQLEQSRTTPTLSPGLLEGWPNPFRDVIQVRFKVPQTVGEAFVWVDEEDAPSDLDLEAAPPWQGNGAACTVKIYNINGQELVTLYDGNVIGGEFQVSWNGADGFGRQVASGTYFCKLQLDEWSVTRRIVYLR